MGTDGLTTPAASGPPCRGPAPTVIHPAQAEDPELRARFRRVVLLSVRVRGAVCPKPMAEDRRNPAWNHTRWSVTLHEASSRVPACIGSDECPP